MQSSKKKPQLFLHFFLYLWNIRQILYILNKEMTLIAHVFPKLRSAKDVVDKCLKSPVSEHRSTVHMLNGV